MSAEARLVLIAIAAAGAGLAIGFLWGAATREEIGGATSVDYSGGVVTVQVNAGQALKQGLAAVFS